MTMGMTGDFAERFVPQGMPRGPSSRSGTLAEWQYFGLNDYQNRCMAAVKSGLLARSRFSNSSSSTLSFHNPYDGGIGVQDWGFYL